MLSDWIFLGKYLRTNISLTTATFRASLTLGLSERPSSYYLNSQGAEVFGLTR